MTNWFEQNPTKSVIAHTIFIASITYVTTRYVFYENSLDDYKAKLDYLTNQVETLNKENENYLRWLESTPNSFPNMEKQLKACESKILKLEKTNFNCSNSKNIDIFKKVRKIKIYENKSEYIEDLDVYITVNYIRNNYFRGKVTSRDIDEEFLSARVGDKKIIKINNKNIFIVVTEIGYLSSFVIFNISIE